MSNEELFMKIKNELFNGRDSEIDYSINGIKYRIKFISYDHENGINIPSIVAIPLVENVSKNIIFEANNMESEKSSDILEQGINTLGRLSILTQEEPGIIVVPLIPSYKDAPYFQQLSKECFDLPKDDLLYRVDEQIVRMIAKTKNMVLNEFGINLDNKIFLNGYSSSGVFAQRFSLLHPEMIDTVCIGGASGSIPVPSDDLDYPLGVKDYEELMGKKFDFEQYKDIKFRYYVGEYETFKKSNCRYDDNGEFAPMHDMSYFNRSVPVDVGKKQRELFGKDMFERANRTVQVLKSLGLNIEHHIIKGRGHNNYKDIVGVNELGDRFITDSYREFIEENKNRKM